MGRLKHQKRSQLGQAVNTLKSQEDVFISQEDDMIQSSRKEYFLPNLFEKVVC